uniref:Uncharacterized protein n=1 Tax=Ciona intestinalis TaxID=7719 RepID=H2XVH2_CIOIN
MYRILINMVLHLYRQYAWRKNLHGNLEVEIFLDYKVKP